MNTTTTQPTNASRATDAKLHERLFGVKCEMRWCLINWLDCGAWQEFESGFPHYDQQMMAERFAPNKDYDRQPCYLVRAATPGNMISDYGVVPHYSTDDIAMRRAELALAPELREDYTKELEAMFDYCFTEKHVKGAMTCVTNYTTLYALITATAEQRAQALVQVLERMRGEVGQQKTAG